MLSFNWLAILLDLIRLIVSEECLLPHILIIASNNSIISLSLNVVECFPILHYLNAMLLKLYEVIIYILIRLII